MLQNAADLFNSKERILDVLQDLHANDHIDGRIRYWTHIHDVHRNIGLHRRIDVGADTAQKIMAKSAIAVREDSHSHVRQRLPGDYSRKLQSSTIAKLNKFLARELATLGYPI